MEYWKYFPERWLLSDKVREMPLIAVAGYRFLCDHAMMIEPLPGILPIDDEKLRGWSRLNSREWKRYREGIFGNFEFLTKKEGNGVSEWLGQHFIRQLFEAWARQKWEASAAARAAVSRRWAKSGDIEAKMPPYTSVYLAYTKKVTNNLLCATPSSPLLATGDSSSEGNWPLLPPPPRSKEVIRVSSADGIAGRIDGTLSHAVER